jgi:hypothetical protein
MAGLPHAVTIKNRTLGELEEIQAWCMRTWPNTHQATWYGGWPRQALVMASRGLPHGCYEQTWQFQREEDAVMFRMAWCL